MLCVYLNLEMGVLSRGVTVHILYDSILIIAFQVRLFQFNYANIKFLLHKHQPTRVSTKILLAGSKIQGVVVVLPQSIQSKPLILEKALMKF